MPNMSSWPWVPCATPLKKSSTIKLAHGEKVGLVKVRLYRPFVAREVLPMPCPQSVKTISVLDRTKEPGALGEPLYLDVVAALASRPAGTSTCLGGRYGLGSKDTPSCNIFAVYRQHGQPGYPKRKFTIGINDDVTNLSLKDPENVPDTTPDGTISCKFWGLGGDGTVGANKNSIKIIGDHTDMYAQAYFALRLQEDRRPDRLPPALRQRADPFPLSVSASADFVACHNPSYVDKYDIVQDVKPGGTFLLNCQWDPEELDTASAQLR